MQISFLLSSLKLSGGVRVVVEFANRLTERGHLVTLVAPGNTIEADVGTELDDRVIIVGSNVTCKYTSSILQKVRLTWSLASLVPPSDIVISTHTPTTVAGLLASRLWRRGHLVWLFQDYREMFAGRPVEDWLLRHALRWHKCALAISHYARDELKAYSNGKIVIVGEGLSHAEYFHPLASKERQRESELRTIMFLGDMRPRKGLFDFLQASALVYEQIQDIRLLIVSKEECHIESTVPFEYRYRPSRQELGFLYATCELFVSASWHESFGLPPLEAMACGAPVVLTDSGGVREYAQTGTNCIMVPTRDPKALSDAMIKLLTDEALSQHLRENGPPTAARFVWENAVDRLEIALMDVL